MNSIDHTHRGGKVRAPIGRKKPIILWDYPVLKKEKNE